MQLDSVLGLRVKEGDMVRQKQYKLSMLSDLVKRKPERTDSRTKFLAQTIKKTSKHLQSSLKLFYVFFGAFSKVIGN